MMKVFTGISLSPTESRNRSAGNLTDDSGKRKSNRSLGYLKELDKYHILLPPERSSSFKISLKLALFIITCCTVMSILHAPTVDNEHQPRSSSRWRIVDAGWLWKRDVGDPRYASDAEINWLQLSSSVLKNVYNNNKDVNEGRNNKVGLLNLNDSEIGHWNKAFPEAETSLVRLEYADPSITWQVLYPEWIDEEQENEVEVPTCPTFPEPQVSKQPGFDLVVVKLPCNASAGSWSRDVARLHLQLTAAKLAVASASGNHPDVHVLFVTDCFPIPNLFPCKDLVKREGSAWLYKPDITRLQESLQLPIGSCQLAIPLKAKVRPYTEVTGYRSEAYATILHSAEKYVCGAIAAAESIRLAGSRRDLVILVDKTISTQQKESLEAAGWKVRIMERIRNPKAERDAYNEWNYSKFRLWQLTDYDKIIFIDADLLVLRNIDFLFTMPEVSATGNDATLFNSGVMVVEPCNCTFQLLMDHINEITSYNGGDQGYLNEIFTWWHRIPKHMNFLKHFWYGDTEAVKAKKTMLYKADTPILYVLHYLGLKPWLCFRDYDCNWNSELYRDFASDEAHATWWGVHDTMPKKLQDMCLLSSFEKAHLEYNRRKAEKAKFADGHWMRNVTDPRLHICHEKFCSWEKLLLHWGETNSTKDHNEVR